MSALQIDSQITFLYVADLQRAARFYEDALGLKLALDQGACRIYRVDSSGAYIGVCQAVDARVEPASIIFTLVTPDVDGWYERISGQGWECEHPPRYNEVYDIYHFFVRDPSGYRIEIQRFPQTNWDQSE